MSEIMALIGKWIKTSSKKQKVFAALLAVSLLVTGILLMADGASNTSSDPLGSTSFYFVSAFVKLMGVLLLIVGSSIIFRRWFQTGPNGKIVRQMRLLETVRLSPKQALHLIVIGDQKLLIGATDQNVSLIAHVEDGVQPAPVQESQTQQAGLDFGSLIQSFNLKLPSENLKGKE
jgi:flagellar biosynthetic protein FliO